MCVKFSRNVISSKDYTFKFGSKKYVALEATKKRSLEIYWIVFGYQRWTHCRRGNIRYLKIACLRCVIRIPAYALSMFSYDSQTTGDKSEITWTAISHINDWDRVNSKKKLRKIWNGPLCWNKSGPFFLLNVAAYWKSSNTKACRRYFQATLIMGGEVLISEFESGIV